MKMWLKIWAKKWTGTQKFSNRLCSKLDMPIKRTKKTKELCFRFPNAELGMLFYGTIALILHLIVHQNFQSNPPFYFWILIRLLNFLPRIKVAWCSP